MPSETYGRNGATPIFRSFHRTASSTINVLIYIILSTTVSFFEDTILFLQNVSSVFHFLYISIFPASTLCMCVMYLTDSFDDRRSQCHLI